MALSVVDLYTKILPKTNCRDCGFPTCIAFAGMVVSEKHPLKNCPHIPADLLESAAKELEQQYKEGKWLKKDMATEALQWARQKAASMSLSDIAGRIGGRLETRSDTEQIVLPYFNGSIRIFKDRIETLTGRELSRNEQTFIFIHMAQGGSSDPSGEMKSLKEFPNTVSKIVSMVNHVEQPLIKAFSGKTKELSAACRAAGGMDVSASYDSCDYACRFDAFPKVPVVLLFWDAQEDFSADVKFLFDKTITDHLDIESIMFLSEHIRDMILLK